MFIDLDLRYYVVHHNNRCTSVGRLVENHQIKALLFVTRVALHIQHVFSISCKYSWTFVEAPYFACLAFFSFSVRLSLTLWLFLGCLASTWPTSGRSRELHRCLSAFTFDILCSPVVNIWKTQNINIRNDKSPSFTMSKHSVKQYQTFNLDPVNLSVNWKLCYITEPEQSNNHHTDNTTAATQQHRCQTLIKVVFLDHSFT